MRLKNYLDDGADWQAQAVLAYLRSNLEIASSYNKELHRYDAIIEVGRWENCREQGYILSLVNKSFNQLNIIFFEHRNSDDICAVMWKQNSINSLTINTAVFDGVYKDKYDVSFSVPYGEITAMGKWINQQFNNHWLED